RPLLRRRIGLRACLRALENLRAQRRNVDFGRGLKVVEFGDDVVPGDGRLGARGRRNRQQQCARQKADVIQASRGPHHRYPASTMAWVQFRLTPCAVIRQGTALLVSLVEPLHSLTISRVQAFATVMRAAMRFWIASKLER